LNPAEQLCLHTKFPQLWVQDTTQLLKERLSTGGPQIAADPQTLKSQIKTLVIVLYIGRYNYNRRKGNSVLPLTNIFVHSFNKK